VRVRTAEAGRARTRIPTAAVLPQFSLDLRQRSFHGAGL